MGKMSSLEQVVYRILIEENISFVQEKQFKDCYNGLYRFDYYIPSKNIAIELNGAQHYKFVSAFYKKKSDFTKAQERDRRKISYCLAQNIKLYVIPYWEIDNINNFSDIIQDKFLAKTKYHNDDIWRQQNF